MELQTVFFSWKLRSICKFWIQNHFSAILGGWDISKTKWGSRNSDNLILSYFELVHILKDKTRWPVWITWGLCVLIRGYHGQSGGCQRPFGFSKAASDTAGQYEYQFFYFRSPFCFSNISAAWTHTELVLYSKFAYGSQFSGEKTVCNSVAWFTSYNSSCDIGEFLRFF